MSDTIELRARVRPNNFVKAHQAAESLGISMAAYMDQLLAREQLDENGRPLWWTDPVPSDQEELPLSQSA